MPDLMDDPIRQFAAWFAEAQAHPEIVLAETVCLSTLGPDQTPEGRMVLLKGFDERGFVFYTNLGSNKARALREHPRAGLTFHWIPLGRQVRLRGGVTAVSDEEADEYFATRPRGSQVGAWASDQSRPLGARQDLEARVAEVEGRYEGRDVPRPPHWSGFRIAPDAMEFWQEGRFRLHDRFVYSRAGASWAAPQRLFP
ncbi:MAG: pyridoxamine 5'-phosphate oxidase [Gemmatimonadetes bacterium]|nr:pyridoxamine 5'-phosphate oxidase [Gemmatimonadota bacterium]